MQYSYSFSEKVRDLTPILEVLQEKAPRAISLFKIQGTAKSKHEWYDMTDAPTESVLGASASAGDGTISVVVPTGMVAGDTLALDDSSLERVTVASVSGTTITLTANLSNDHAAGVRVLRISKPTQEGSTENIVDYSQATLLYNYMEIFRRDVKLARSIIGHTLEEARDNIIDAAVNQHMLQIWREINNALIWEERRAATGTTATTTGKLGGLLYWTFNDSNGISSSCSGAALTETLLNTFLASIRKKGGDPDSILCNVETAQKIGSFVSSAVIVNQTTEVAGIQLPVSKFMGNIPGMKIKQLVIDEAMPDTALIAVTSSKLFLRPHENEGAIHDYDSTSPGFDGIQRTILGEYTVEIQNPYNAHGCLYNFTN